MPQMPELPYFKDSTAAVGSLLGEFGTNAPFLVGDTLINYSPQTSGPLSMVCNDDIDPAVQDGYTDNSGEQIVRVIVTQ